MGSSGAPLPSPETRRAKSSGGGNLQHTGVGLQVFRYSWLCLTIIVYLWMNLFGVIYVTMQVGMSLFDPFDPDSLSPKAAMGVGYFVALLFLAALFGMTCLAKRGVPIYAAIIAVVCLLFGALIFVESRELVRTVQSVVEWCGLATKVLTYTAMVAIFIGWCLCLSGPSKFRLPVVVGLISVPLIALCFWLADQTGESRRNFKTSVLWLAAGVNVALPTCQLASAKLCERLAEHKGNRRVPKSARSAWLQLLIAYGISLAIVAIVLLLEPVTVMQCGVWFALAPPLAAVFSAIVLMELLTDTADLV